LKTYEGMFIVDNRHANRDWDRVVGHVTEIVVKHGGKMIRCEKWGERKLAYPILGHKRGTYLLAYFEGVEETVNRVYREVELSESLVRALILAIDKVPAAGSSVAPAEPPEPAEAKDKAAAPAPRAGAAGETPAAR
jgi:ribosomal protein S6